MEDLFAAIQPGNDAGTPTPPAPEPPTPEVPELPANTAEQVNAEEKADEDEWGDAIDNIFPGLQKSQEEDNGQVDATKKSEEAGADKGANEKAKSNEDAGKSGEDGEEESADGTEEVSGEDEQTGPPELSASDRQELEQSVKSEISQKMFTEEINGKPFIATPDGSKYGLDANGRPVLADADGDPIRGIDDVMKLVNPRTGQPFTEEQAGMWLLNANQNMRENLNEMSNQINEIASTGITMKEESEAVAWQYGELLKAMPDLQKDLWADYEKTLVKDPKTGIVTKAPISLQKFYERALTPYAELAQKLETDTGNPQQSPNTRQAPVTPQAPDRSSQEQARQQRRQDRSDIYGGGKVDDATDDDKEWGAAASAVFGDQLNGLRR
jgi:hypothetical protein